MAVKIRLARHGKKNYAFYHIVVTDSRSPRDGRFIERIGTYNPNTKPALIELDGDKALQWLFNGAQPTDTCRRILSYKGVLLKKHLQEGVKKGAITQEVADQKWNAWIAEKEAKISTVKSNLAQNERDTKKVAIEAEAKVNETRAEEIAKKKRIEAEKAEKVAKAEAQETAGAEVAVEETVSVVEEVVSVVEEATPVAEEIATVVEEVASVAEETATVVEEAAPSSEEATAAAEEVPAETQE